MDMKLKHLGKQGKSKNFDKPTVDILDFFENPSKNTYEIVLDTEEFTSLCPKTGQPDFATIQVQYVPRERCIETKSLKLYLRAYRMYRGFMEQITNKILDDLVYVINPYAMLVTGQFTSRGGIRALVKATYENFTDGNEEENGPSPDLSFGRKTNA